MCTCARLATVRSPSANARPSRNSLKPCFVEKRTGTRASVPGHLAVGVGVDEVRVQDRRPVRARGSATSCTNATGSTSARSRDRVERHAARLERAGEVPGARLVLVQHQHADVPAALAQPRQQREQVRLGAGDAGDLLQMEDVSPLIARHLAGRASAQCSTEWSRRDALAQLAAERAAVGVERREREPLGEALGVVAVEAELRSGSRSSKTGFDASTGRQRRRRLVDDLVGRAGAHVVDEHVGCARRARAPRRAAPAWPSSTRSPRSSSSRAARARRGARARRRRATGRAARAASSRRRARADAAQDRLEPLRRRVAAERERAQPLAVLRARREHENSARSIPWPIATHLRRVERERAPVDLSDRGRDAARQPAASRDGFQCVNQRSSGTPSGRASGAASTA